MSKSPILAFILSAIPGLGHIYAVGLAQGLVYALVIWATISISMWLCLFLVGFVMLPVVYVGGAVHAAVLSNDQR